MIGPRAVLYTRDLEPITVLEVTHRMRELLLERGVFQVRVYEPLARMWSASPDEPVRIWTISIHAERLVYRRQNHLLLVTDDDEAALLLKAAFLPGQQQALNDRHARAFGEGFLAALRELRG